MEGTGKADAGDEGFYPLVGNVFRELSCGRELMGRNSYSRVVGAKQNPRGASSIGPRALMQRRQLSQRQAIFFATKN